MQKDLCFVLNTGNRSMRAGYFTNRNTQMKLISCGKEEV